MKDKINTDILKSLIFYLLIPIIKIFLSLKNSLKNNTGFQKIFLLLSQ
jgi:hypothetical protein